MSDSTIIHPKYGRGDIVLSRHKGYQLYVKFEDGYARWVNIDEIREIKKVSTSSADLVSDTNQKGYSPTDAARKNRDVESLETKIGRNADQTQCPEIEVSGDIPGLESSQPPATSQAIKASFQNGDFISRKMIEAFRLGIVPQDCVSNFTFGRETELRQLTAWLESDRSASLLLGEYGAGKTHILNYISEVALNQRFAVARVEIRPEEVPFHKPKRIYSDLIKTFQWEEKPSGKRKQFRSFLAQAFKKGVFRDHRYFQFLDGSDEENLWEWIEGSERVARPQHSTISDQDYSVRRFNYLPPLYDYPSAANIYCHLLSSLGWAAKEVMGLKGLLITFDEAEKLTMSTGQQVQRARNFLGALYATAQGQTHLLERPVSTRWDFCSRASDVTFLYKQPSGLRLLFAFTPFHSPDGWFTRSRFADEQPYEFLATDLTIEKIHIKPLSDQALRSIFAGIWSLYKQAYEFRNAVDSDEVIRYIMQAETGTRGFVKGSVEALDLIRFYQGHSLEDVLD